MQALKTEAWRREAVFGAVGSTQWLTKSIRFPPSGANGQMIACTLAATEQSICATSLEFFLATQSAVGAHLGSSNLAQMEAAISTFVDHH